MNRNAGYVLGPELGSRKTRNQIDMSLIEIFIHPALLVVHFHWHAAEVVISLTLRTFKIH